MIKTISLILLSILYIAAGINHFWHPRFYLRIMPSYIPAHENLVSLSGLIEIGLGILVLFPQTRTLACYGLILMLLAFLPVHIDMLAHPPMHAGKLIINPVLTWLRLFAQFILIAWAWWHSKP